MARPEGVGGSSGRPRPTQKKGGRPQGVGGGKRRPSSDSRRKQAFESFGGEHERGLWERFRNNIEATAYNSPGGIYAFGKAGLQDAAQAITPHGPGHEYHPPTRLANIGKASAEQFLQDLRHPLRNPGYTLLDLWGLASLGGGGVARGAAGARAAKAGESVAQALITRPKPGPRVLEHGGMKVTTGSYSKNAALRGAQKLLDQVRQAFPEATIGLSDHPTRVGKAAAKQRQLEEAIARAPAAALKVEGKKLPAGEQEAIRVVAEGVPVKDRIRFYAKQVGSLKGARRREARKRIAYLQAAQTHLDDTGLAFKDPGSRVSRLYADAKALAEGRDEALTSAGFLSAGAKENRVAAPGEIIRNALGEDIFGGGRGEFRVPYSRKRTKAGADKIASSGQGNMVGIERKPGSLTHSFEGKILESGGGRNDVTTLIAESNIEAQRFTALSRARDKIRDIAVDDPAMVPEKHRVAVNMGVLDQVPQAVREILDKATPDAKLSPDEIQALGQAFESIRREVFPDRINPERVAGFKWIDKRLLGGLDKPNPLVGFNYHNGLQRTLRVTDQINSASKLAILYLKPAYAIPNLVGNLFLTLVQQGVFAPKNLAEAARLNSKLGVKATRAIDEVMGEGISGALGHDRGVASRATNFAAGAFGKVVDTPFRRSSFLHESRRQGYRTKAEINKLLFDETAKSDLLEVAQRANADLIDYQRLGPFERDIVRRVIFFYPWVKGATMYAGRFVGEHPVQAVVMAQLGALGKERQQAELGDVPPWYQGLFRVGGTDENPRVINPASMSIFQTPADVAKLVAGQQDSSANFTPALAAIMTLITGENSLGFPVEGNRALAAGKGLYQSAAPYTLGRRLGWWGKQSETTHYSPRDALLAYLIGGTPFTADRSRLNDQAK